MSSSRENSPDWLRCFKAPTAAHSTLELSSDSEPSPVGSPLKEERSDCEELSLHKPSKTIDDEENLGKVLGESGNTPSSKKSILKSPKKGQEIEGDKPPEKNKSYSRKKRKGDEGSGKVAKKVAVESPVKSRELNHSIWTLSSDSELSPKSSLIRENHMHQEESFDQKTLEETGKGNDAALIGSNEDSPSKKASKVKPPRKGLEVDGHASVKEKKKSCVKREGGDVEVAEEEAPEKQIESHVSSTRLPLMLSEKVHRSKALVECEGDTIDLGGDMGAVGRVMISDTSSGDHEMYLDLKGTIYKTTIVPSRTFCVVSFGQSEAKIEAIMNDFIQLKPQSNVFEAETMVEGTLDGFSFDSDEEADRVPKTHQADPDEDVEEKTNGKTKGKAEKTSGVARKRGKAAGGKAQPQKKVKRKAQVSKKAKTKK
ncbi:double-stranded DNA binding protein [Trema orientale]|uniref:Double-stranded DNA binding protein n=1 Tax=Trema orientale TaxID=63057 RepID=A0A2P5EDV2_TREOI|nr:double-stranded DNA binding protein [Trema orientale]